MEDLENAIVKWESNIHKRKCSGYWISNMNRIEEIARAELSKGFSKGLDGKAIIRRAEKLFREVQDEEYRNKRDKMQNLMNMVDLDRAKKNYDEAVKLEQCAWDSKVDVVTSKENKNT